MSYRRDRYSAQGTYNHVQHRRELRKDQDLVTSFKESVKESLQQQHFPTCIDQVVVHDQISGFWITRPVKQEGMTGNLKRKRPLVAAR